MRPCRIVFAVLAVAAFQFAGCRSPRRTGFLGNLFASRTAVKETPGQPEDEPFILHRDENAQGENIPIAAPKPAPPATSMLPSMNTHNQETLTYIDRELRDANAREREEWFKKLKPLSADMVRLVLQTRRIGIERGQQKTNRNLSGQNLSRIDSYHTPPDLTDLTRNNNDYRSFRPGYTTPQNQTGMQQPPNGPYGSSDLQNQGYRSRPERLSAPDPRSNRLTSNKLDGPNPGNRQGNDLFPPPAPPAVSNNRFTQNTSSPLNAIQNPQRPSFRSGTNNSLSNDYVQMLPRPGQPLQIERPGTNILWNEEILRIISLTESDVARSTPGTTDDEIRRYTEKHVFLRMLYLMAGKQAQAFESIPRISPEDQEFWQQILWGIANYFYADAMPEKADRSAQALAQIRNAIERLQVTANLEIKNVAFCKKITNFGNFEKFDRDEFRPGDTVLVYAEVENFKSESSEGGKFRTVMKSDIEILRSGVNGGRIDLKEYSPAEDFCSSPRKDYFHAYRYEIPRDATLGPHVIKLTIEDQLGGKVASYTMNFTIK